jgi:hypothetical protein
MKLLTVQLPPFSRLDYYIINFNYNLSDLIVRLPNDDFSTTQTIKSFCEVMYHYVYVSLLGCNAVWTSRCVSSFRRNTLPPSSLVHTQYSPTLLHNHIGYLYKLQKYAKYKISGPFTLLFPVDFQLVIDNYFSLLNTMKQAGHTSKDLKKIIRYMKIV